MTREQAESLNLGIQIRDKTLIIIEAALDIVLSRTSIKFDRNSFEEIKKMPARVKLFVIKYIELMSLVEGVSSQSISNLSISFSQDKNERLNNLLEEMLGDDRLSDVKFTEAVNRWE